MGTWCYTLLLGVGIEVSLGGHWPGHLCQYEYLIQVRAGDWETGLAEEAPLPQGQKVPRT